MDVDERPRFQKQCLTGLEGQLISCNLKGLTYYPLNLSFLNTVMGLPKDKMPLEMEIVCGDGSLICSQ